MRAFDARLNPTLDEVSQVNIYAGTRVSFFCHSERSEESLIMSGAKR